MNFFQYKKNELFAEEVPVRQLAEEFGTPLYLYSRSAIETQLELFQKAFGKTKFLLCYSMKCNSNIALLKMIGLKGAGVDIVSGGELYRALKAGINPKKIVFAGVGKTENEIAEAIRAGILSFNVESEAELETIHEVASKLKKKAPVSLRVNPNIDPKTHPYITTGLKKSKFGIEIKRAYEVYQYAASLPFLEIVGIDCHIGSQLTEVQPFVDSVMKVKELILSLKKKGIDLKYLDLGGGLGIRYKEETPPSPQVYAQEILKALKDIDLTLIFEPGRFIMGNSGLLVTETVYLKQNPAKNFVIVDAAMNDLIRPTLYESYHEIQPVVKKRRDKIKVDIVGPICESGDFFAKDREIQKVAKGELLAIFSAGAYGFSMSSNYNSRTRAAEVLVDGKKYELIRQREKYADLIKGEKIPDFLKK